MHGKYTLKGTLLYPDQTSPGKLSLFVLMVLIIGFVLSGLVTSFNATLVDRYLAWLPEWFFFYEASQYSKYSELAILVTLTVNLIVNGIVAPIVEELYYRGNLLPKISWLRHHCLTQYYPHSTIFGNHMRIC